MAVRAHKSWMITLDMFDEFLYEYFSIKRTSNAKPSILSDDYALWSIRNNHLLKQIKNRADYLTLPKMERKWKRIT